VGGFGLSSDTTGSGEGGVVPSGPMIVHISADFGTHGIEGSEGTTGADGIDGIEGTEGGEDREGAERTVGEEGTVGTEGAEGNSNFGRFECRSSFGDEVPGLSEPDAGVSIEDELKRLGSFRMAALTGAHAAHLESLHLR